MQTIDRKHKEKEKTKLIPQDYYISLMTLKKTLVSSKKRIAKPRFF